MIAGSENALQEFRRNRQILLNMLKRTIVQ